MNESAEPAIILLAHGARDPRWGEPFQRIADRVRAAAPDLVVELAYLGAPRAGSCGGGPPALGPAGRARIRVVPLFFGRGGHLREDVPRQIAAAGEGAARAWRWISRFRRARTTQ